MDARRKQVLALGGLLTVLAIVVAWQWTAEPAPAAGAARSRTATASAATASGAAELPRVDLALLEHPRSEPVDAARDLFKFEARRRKPAADEDAQDDDGEAPAAGRPGTASQRPAPPAPPVSTEPPPPPPPPPIPLKFIGVVQRLNEGGKIAVLSDGRGVYHGREGDVVEGRYRILKIGNESVEMVYLDGRGRQVIRLSGA